MKPGAILTAAALVVLTNGCDNYDDVLTGIWQRHHGGSKPTDPSEPATDPDPGDSKLAPKLPKATRACPKIDTGTLEFLGVPVQVWLGQQRDGAKRPVLFYWHGTGSNPGEAEFMLGDTFNEILAEGALVVSPGASLETGHDSGFGTWYTGDFAVSDEVLGCALEQLDIDTRRIYTAGCSAGGLQAGEMAYLRSGYLAGAIPNSGGIVMPEALQDPDHVTPVMAAHGSAESDVVIVSFEETSKALTDDLVSKGGFAVRCNHGGGHCGSPAEVKSAQWQFLKDHPFGTDPEPYEGGLPDGFPSYCEIVE